MSATITYAARNRRWIPLAGGDPVDPQPAVSELLVPRSGAWWGAYTGGTPADTAAWEATTGRKMDVASAYFFLGQRITANTFIDGMLSAGRIPLINVETRNQDGTYIPWADVKNGVRDADIDWWGTYLAGKPGKIMVSFNHEPAYSVNNASQVIANYIPASRRFHDRVMAKGAHNVVWVWWVAGNESIESLAYPGDSYVDWITFDPYKWSGHALGETPKQTWQGTLNWINAHGFGVGKPRGLSETAVDANAYSEQTCIDWWKATPQAAADLGLKMVVFYDRIQWKLDAKPNIITGGYKPAGLDARFRQPHA